MAGLYLPYPDPKQQVTPVAYSKTDHEPQLDDSVTAELIRYFEDYPLERPYSAHFGELGQRTGLLRDLLNAAEESQDPSQQEALLATVDRGAASLYPYLHRPPKGSPLTGGLSHLRSSFIPGSAGIVIPVGNANVRFAAQLIASMRHVLRSMLPIQVVYAGEDDLSPDNRKFLAAVVKSMGPPIEFLDILTVFDDETLRLRDGTWAIKPFAVLGSHFEKVILVDADAVFLQKPEVLLDQLAFQRSGTLLFRDRLIFQHTYYIRHKWWRSQIKHPSETLNKSRAWTDDYGEEGDSGVVVLDKGRTGVLLGLLHTCWQNSYKVREEVTYQIMYGDKESWWMGLELTGARYEMEEHYAAIVGWPREAVLPKDKRAKVCSFVIAHLDENDKLLWYNGGLLKNKKMPRMGYEVPTSWMVDGEWQKGYEKEDMSCMVGADINDLSGGETETLKTSVKVAKTIDAALQN
ncbi:family 71 glycosyltransferase [Cryphonectria parasitica EP155]|uniref:Family 71 glycosyltransferase n=1 Tax=Cryphonectria parasitica (strain ATCC 38755 / EP155) TaxID=660469 RepID=A0A9P4XW44_CRYP1|nr:family 71 glycosyltransferase [Cryphonectria parasitica EP155]KAF3761860.1 family 71 glycosyltransferase [Cryphonectria parasitica EP155]